MDKDNGPDTIQMKEDAERWAATHTDDVFDPAVRVTLGWRDVETAVERGAVVPAQAHALWAGWAALAGPHRVAASPTVASAVPVQAPAQPNDGAPQGASLGLMLRLLLAGALGGALLGYLVFAP